jgi:hypothetical protein
MKTSYYTHAASLNRTKFFLVRTSLGSPRFLKCDENAQFLAPDREWLDLSESAYRRKYIAKLNKFGVPAFKSEFSKIQKAAGKREIVLLCYESLSPEKVAEGQFCHRRIFADWWEQQTGEKVAEVSPHQKVQIQPTLL